MGERLKGRVAIVTGAGRGIGRGVALQLADEGASVVIADFGSALDGSGRDTGPAAEVANEIKAAGGRAIPHYGDVSKMADVQDLVATALREFGRVDIICHSAGILRDRMVFNMSEEEWDAVLATHLRGAFNLARSVVAPMIEQRHGRIVLFSSLAGLGSVGQTNYSSAKEAMVGLARSLARELGPHGITVNAIIPAGATRMTDTIQGQGTGASAARASPGAPRPMDPENNAPSIAWLCTDAGGVMNGQVVATMGWQASLYSPRHVVRSVHQSRPWTIEEINRALPRGLLGGLVNPAPRAAEKAAE
ncbi:MAG: SDR family oxidoreductase [Dehalococcoidia bacterium]|nr:SDR family oxidoreductase [Dehalococcoidia bacterium]